jgi:hypothetical protein
MRNCTIYRKTQDRAAAKGRTFAAIFSLCGSVFGRFAPVSL